MKTFGNIIWLIFGGLIASLLFFVFGFLLCITIIGIPFGKQCFKCAKLVLAPFGKKVTLNPAKHAFTNAIWVFLFGWEIALCLALASIVLAITIIGLPIAKQTIKFAKLALFPFGAEVY